MDRRTFLKHLGAGTAGAAVTLAACDSKGTQNATNRQVRDIPTDQMTYRTAPRTGERVSLLGYGCMRWPTVAGGSAREGEEPIDQQQVNRLVDFALAHGVNYFDTSPAYCKGQSEEATGIALSRHPRKDYFIATKLSNFDPSTWSHAAGVRMYEHSRKMLRTEVIDYMLLHCIGQQARDASGRLLSGMEAFEERYVKNGMLDFLLAEREAGRIRNLGFSYHGDIDVFDRLLAEHGKYRWDFAQIQLNYVDWQHAKEVNEVNTNGEYLYHELHRRHIPAIIMEPLLGGRLASLPDFAAARMKRARPDESVASWAFRYAATRDGVLTVLSGMTYMEHLKDNLRTFCPLDPCTQEEMQMLHEIAQAYVDNPFVPCTRCQYCMPCPYGVDIPSVFAHYNRCINEEHYHIARTDPKYAAARRAWLVGYDRSVPRLRGAAHCIGCGKCVEHCPQRIDIPKEMHRIDAYAEELRRGL